MVLMRRLEYRMRANISLLYYAVEAACMYLLLSNYSEVLNKRPVCLFRTLEYLVLVFFFLRPTVAN